MLIRQLSRSHNDRGGGNAARIQESDLAAYRGEVGESGSDQKEMKAHVRKLAIDNFARDFRVRSTHSLFLVWICFDISLFPIFTGCSVLSIASRNPSSLNPQILSSVRNILRLSSHGMTSLPSFPANKHRAASTASQLIPCVAPRKLTLTSLVGWFPSGYRILSRCGR